MWRMQSNLVIVIFKHSTFKLMCQLIPMMHSIFYENAPDEAMVRDHLTSRMTESGYYFHFQWPPA